MFAAQEGISGMKAAPVQKNDSSGELSLSQNDFQFFRGLIHETAGISLSDSKMELVQSRLRSRVIALGMSGFGEYRKYLQQASQDQDEWQTFINSLTTNKTDFFREPKHFDYLVKDFLPTWKPRGAEPLNIWCAASSTGEEPYTLSMVLARAMAPTMRTYKILATDIDTDALAAASRGVYPASRIDEQIPQEYRSHAIEYGTGGIANWARIHPNVKNKITYEPHNLIEPKIPGERIFDLIFLRNVLIYFTPETILQVVEKLHKAAKPGGLLFIGHSESLNNVKSSWTSVSPSVYIKKADK